VSVSLKVFLQILSACQKGKDQWRTFHIITDFFIYKEGDMLTIWTIKDAGAGNKLHSITRNSDKGK
jgi:hypothetical protein